MNFRWSLVGLVFLSLGAKGDLLDLTGSWALSGELQSSHRIEMIVHRVYNDKDRQELMELREKGFACVYANANTYRCRRTIHGEWVPSNSHKSRLSERYKDESFELVHMGGEASLVTEGDSVRQWQLPHIAYNKFGKTSDVIYWEHSDGSAKLQFEIQKKSYWPHFTSDDVLFFRDVVTETDGNHINEFWYDVTFIRKKD